MRFRQTLGLSIALALGLGALPAYAKAVAAPSADIGKSQAEEDQAMAKAFTLVAQGKAVEAEAIFSAVIAKYDRAAEPDVAYRCANGLDGTLSVLLKAATSNAKGTTVALGPNWCAALFGKGYALIDLGRASEAGPFLAKAVAMDPLNAHYLNEYAEWFKPQRQWQRSYDLFAQAWDIVSHDKKGPDRKIAARSLRGMAFNLIELGDYKKAERLYRQSLDFEPEAAAKVQNELDYIADVQAKKKAS